MIEQQSVLLELEACPRSVCAPTVLRGVQLCPSHICGKCIC